MIKEIVVFSFNKECRYEEADEWYFERHVEVTKRIPFLARYAGYRFLRLPKNDFFHEPQYHRMEELWWPNAEIFSKAQESDERQRALECFNEPSGPIEVRRAKRVFVEKEINILSPHMSEASQITMTELDATPHVKGIWPLSYHRSLNVEEADDWYISHHTRVAARYIDFLKYVTWSPAGGFGPSPGFLRYTEQWAGGCESYLDGFQSPNGLKALEDNNMGNGEWRIATSSEFMEYPHVVGCLSVFL